MGGKGFSPAMTAVALRLSHSTLALSMSVFTFNYGFYLFIHTREIRLTHSRFQEFGYFHRLADVDFLIPF